MELRDSTREQVLEQALVEQNQILDVMQELVASLELENKSSQDKIVSQRRQLQEASLWEQRAHRAEEELRTKREGVVGTAEAGVISFAAIAGFEKVLAQKDQLIAMQQSQLATLPQHAQARAGRHQTAVLLASTRAKLEAERVNVIELEEELSSSKEKLGHAHRKLQDRQSVLLAQESEVQFLRHEMDSLKQLSRQQQALVLQLRSALAERDTQLSSISRALDEARQAGENMMQPKLYEQVLSRELVALELQAEEGLGLGYSKVELPVSSRVPCLVVRVVHEGGAAHGKVFPGDELLEVNGYLCRSMAQAKAVACLNAAQGTVRLVLARHADLPTPTFPLHSTPIKSPPCGNSTLWTTALVAPSNSPPSMPLPMPAGTQSQHPIPGGRMEEMSQENLAEMTDPTAELEGLLEAAQAELETAHEELEALQLEHDLVKAENYELQQQLCSRESDVDETWTRVAEMEKMLVNVQEQVSEDDRKIASLEACNTSLERQLDEAKTISGSTKTEVEDYRMAAEKLAHEAAKMESGLKAETARLASQIQQLQADIAQREAEGTSLRGEVEARDHELELVTEQSAKLQSELTALQQNTAKAISLAEEEARQLKGQLATAKGLLLQAERKEGEKEVEVRALRQTAELTRRQLSAQEEEAKAAREEMGRYKHLVEAKTLETENLTLNAKLSKSRLDASKHSLARLQAEVDTLRKVNAHLQAAATRLEGIRAQAQVQTSNDQSEISLLKEKLANSVEERDLLFQQMEEAMERESSLEQQLDAAQGDSKVAEQRETQLQGAHHEARKELDVYNKRTEELQQQCSRLQGEKKSQGAKLEATKKEVQEQTEKVGLLCSSLKEQEKKALEVQVELGSVLRELDQVRQQAIEGAASLEQLHGDLTLERSQGQRWKENCEQLHTKMESLDTQYRRSKELVASMEFVHEQDQLKLGSLEAALQGKTAELKGARANLSILVEESTGQISHLQVERSGITTQLEKVQGELKKIESSHSKEMAILRGRLVKLEEDLAGVRKELQTERSINSINTASIALLRADKDQAEAERNAVKKELEAITEKSCHFSEEATKVTEQLNLAELRKVELESTSSALANECSLLKEQLAETRSRLEAVRGTLAVSQQSLQEVLSKEREQKIAMEDLDRRLQEKERELQRDCEEKERIEKELLHHNERLSQLTTSAGLQARECIQLREAIVTAESKLAFREHRITSLERELHNMQESVLELQVAREQLCEEVGKEQRKAISRAEEDEERIAVLQEQGKALKVCKTDLENRVGELETALTEAQATARQLLAAQEALQEALGSLGEEKSKELLQLSHQVTELESALLQSSEGVVKAGEREKQLETEIVQLQGQSTELSNLCEELEQENRRLHRDEAEHQCTEDRLSELSTKVDSLKESLRTKTARLATLEEEGAGLQRDLGAMEAESETLLGKVSELAGLKLELAERSSSLQRLQGTLAAEVHGREALTNERDQLLAVLRRLEVDKHTAAPPPSDYTAAPPPSDSGEGASQQELLELLRDKEEESFRLREYVGKLLSSVVERAPFVLENMH